MKEVMEKLKSDRLWALGAFIALLIANAVFNIGLKEAEISAIMWAVLAFIAGKSVRSTTGGTLFGAFADALLPKGLKALEKTLPDVGKPKDK